MALIDSAEKAYDRFREIGSRFWRELSEPERHVMTMCFEAGRASRDAEVASMQHEIDTANEANSALRAQLAEKEAALARVQALAERWRAENDGDFDPRCADLEKALAPASKGESDG